MDIETIPKIPIPPASIVAELATACKEAIQSGVQSVQCLHMPSASTWHLPIWIITYWSEVLELHATLYKAWVKAEEFIWQRKKVWKKVLSVDNVNDVMEEAYNILSCLSWSGNVLRFDGYDLIYKLATFASHAWLATTHMDEMLDLLWCNV
jgi:hypothetical protein